jgi:hypothetical protein
MSDSYGAGSPPPGPPEGPGVAVGTRQARLPAPT